MVKFAKNDDAIILFNLDKVTEITTLKKRLKIFRISFIKNLLNDLLCRGIITINSDAIILSDSFYEVIQTIKHNQHKSLIEILKIIDANSMDLRTPFYVLNVVEVI